MFDNLDIVDDDGCHHVADPDVIPVAEAIVKRYKQLRPLYTPGRVHIPRKSLVKFYRAAELCIQRGQTPEAFVRGQLEGMARTGQFWPTAIANPLYHNPEDEEELEQRHIRHYQSQMNSFTRLCTLYGVREVIDDPTFQFTPLFRAVMASMFGMGDLVDKYREGATAELRGVPVARAIFTGRLGFIDEV